MSFELNEIQHCYRHLKIMSNQAIFVWWVLEGPRDAEGRSALGRRHIIRPTQRRRQTGEVSAPLQPRAGSTPHRIIIQFLTIFSYKSCDQVMIKVRRQRLTRIVLPCAYPFSRSVFCERIGIQYIQSYSEYCFAHYSNKIEPGYAGLMFQNQRSLVFYSIFFTKS